MMVTASTNKEIDNRFADGNSNNHSPLFSTVDPWLAVREVIGTFPSDYMKDRNQPTWQIEDWTM